uniref:Uncharacterized protein n=1 Tax=Cyprinus carpio TaxID=7962 RepID=A0A8C1LQF9_CYPCA
MRRSGAPSQLRGNAAKKPRFMPPGPSLTDLMVVIAKLTPDLFYPLWVLFCNNECIIPIITP